ncbi:GntR family transcriptional regulator [Cryobacterium sp. MLB-32]|uniref:GntR family transcriptional regulator n=1 Tax=Cryobacterium sp. MLB-32 TaxID=1529318 RepID=UPI000ADA2955|nr:GntR family transcriptional regulator [Cryobacterium sp. MLB-32]
MPESIVSIDSTAAAPPFEQIRTQIIESVRSGALPPGTRLPTVRALATQLGIATNTVARAYRELERDDLIETRGRMGSFIAANGDAAHRHAQEAAIAFAARIEKLGIDPDEALGLVTQSLGALARSDPSS